MLSDQGYVIENLLMIADKQGNDVPMHLNSAQKVVDDAWYSFEGGKDPVRILVPKARQEGVSSYVLARFTIECLSKRNVHAVVISHDQESTQRMLDKVKYFVENMDPRPEISTSSKNAISFPKMGSKFYIGTAGSRKFGRGDTITHLHCSEYAFWPDPKTLITGLFQAVPSGTGEIVIESTGNGYNDYHRRCLRAYSGDSAWKCVFLPWHDFEEYTLDLSEAEREDVLDSLNPDWEENELVGRLSPGQLMWRRRKLDELEYDLDSFKQEYPMTLDECFHATGASMFPKVNFTESPLWKPRGDHAWTLEAHPRPGPTYLFGCDVGAGIGQDPSVIECFCVETGEQVFEYIWDKIDPKAFGHKIIHFARMWNDPYVVVESNNHGILTLDVLNENYESHLIFKQAPAVKVKGDDEDKRLMNLGYRTTVKTKPIMIGRLKEFLQTEFTIYSTVLRDQLSTFIEDESGRLRAQDGCFDDTVMAAACAAMGFNKAAIQIKMHREDLLHKKQNSDVTLLDNAIDELIGNQRGGLLAPQHAGYGEFVGLDGIE